MEFDVKTFAEQVISELRAMGDPVRADGERRYFKGTINNFGVTIPQKRALEKRLCKDLPKTITPGQAMAAAEEILSRRLFEPTLFALTFVERFVDQLGADDLARFKVWLENDWLDDWAAVDTLCPHVVGSMLRLHPELVDEVKSWAASPNQWTRRASAVSFILLLRKGQFLDAAYEIADALLSSKEDLAQKGLGWMLREAGTTDPQRLVDYLLLRGPLVPRTSLRYAIEKFPPEKRKEILALTKAIK